MDESETTDNQTTETNETETTNDTGPTSDVTFDSDVFSQDFSPDFSLDWGNEPGYTHDDYSFGSNLDWDLSESGDSSDDYTSYSNNESEPTMTVDDVYGKGNQSIVESQGDYAASSNEKSNVETSTLGKQDEISVTPLSVAENKGQVSNPAIASIEGLDFQQKDKESQEVLDARKSRDETESKDKANQMREQLIANQESLKSKTDLTEEEKNAINKFQIGEKNTFEEQDKTRLDQLNQKNQELENAKNKEKDAIVAAEKAEAIAKKADKAVEEAQILENRVKQVADRVAEKEAENRLNKGDSLLEGLKKAGKLMASPFTDKELQKLEEEVKDLAKALGTDAADILEAKTVGDFVPGGKETLLSKVQENLANIAAEKVAAEKDNQQKAQEAAKSARTHATDLTSKVQEAQVIYDKAKQEYNTWKTEYWANAEKTKAEEKAPPAVTPKTNAVTPEAKTKATENTTSDIKQTFDNAIKTAVEKGADKETIQAMTDIAAKIDDDQKAMQKAIAENDMPAYIEAQKQYNENLKEALEIGNAFTRTDFNKDFVEAVAKANDFDVTLADGTKTTYSQFATDMATKSPEIAKAMYEAKAKNYEENGHKILAAIENAKAKMVDNWFGSKLTLADNQVRNQFNQMAKTNMRATYAAYNNVLDDKTGKYSDADKAEASAAIKQANSLMTASVALQASTGFFSGIGDRSKDGIYGTTKPGDLNAYQKTLNAIDNFAKIALGLGVTPGANKAYQNMYYMAGAKVDESGLYSKDFDNDGFALCQEYGNNAAAGMIAGAGELATGAAMVFNPAMTGVGINLIVDSVQTFLNGLYGVQKDTRKSEKYTQEVLDYFEEAKDIVAETGNKEAADTIDNAITRIENFELKSDEVGNLDNWLEGSGSNTADNGKFNQSLTYDEWLKLIEADPTMQEYAKKLIAEKKS